LKEHLSITTPEDWYSIHSDGLQHPETSRLLHSAYGGRLDLALNAIYKDTGHYWYPWLFVGCADKLDTEFWKDMDNQAKYFQWLGDRLGIQNMEGWYSVGLKEFYENHGTYLMWNVYFKSPREAIIANFPHHPWKLWLFNRVPPGFWEPEATRREFFDWLGKEKLGFGDDLSQWYKVDRSVVEKYGGRSLLTTYYKDVVAEAVMALYPEHSWKRWMFRQVPKSFVRTPFLPHLNANHGAYLAQYLTCHIFNRF
jgi:hypothetical protein